MSTEQDPFTLPLEELDGASAAELFSGAACYGRGFTFDDMIMLPGEIGFGVQDVSLQTQLTRDISIKMPFVSSPMDTVTEHRMAIQMALDGGIGIIHKNMPMERQVQEVRKVKRFESGFIVDPVCVRADDAISVLDDIRTQRGFSGFPVTETGQPGSRLLGIVTSRDVDFLEDRTVAVSTVMTPADDLYVLRDGCLLKEANSEIMRTKKGRLPVVDADFKLVSMVTRKDLRKNRDWPHASKHSKTKQLLVGAAVGVNDPEHNRQRMEALVDAGVDVVVLDSNQGDSVREIELIRWSKERFPQLQIVGGNVVTMSQVARLIEAGADAIRVGMGVGSVATGQLIKAVGRAQMSAVYHASLVARTIAEKQGTRPVPIIADGGIKNSGCIIKALALGASCVMMGSLLAATEESPGEYYFDEKGMRLKEYRGMHSQEVISAQRGDRSNVRLAQGVKGAVVDKGSVHRFLLYQAQSVKHGFQDVGVQSIDQLHTYLFNQRLRFEVRSGAAMREGGVHDLAKFSANPFM